MRDRYASLREGLVGAWIPSVSGSGLLLPDLSGQGNNGALTNMGPEDWVSAQYGRALDFDGVNDYVNVGNGGNRFFLPKDVTVSFWYKGTNQSAGIQRAICAASTNGSHAPFAVTYGFGSGNGGKIQLWNAASGPSLTASTVSMDGVFHHGAAVRGAAGSFLFLDGKQDGFNGQTTGQTIDLTPALSIGRFGGFNGYYVDCQLDDIRIYNRALSASEIKLLASRPGIGLRPQRRTMYYAPPTGARRRRILTSMP